MDRTLGMLVILALLLPAGGASVSAQSRSYPGQPDSTVRGTTSYDQGEYLNTWGVDIMISTNGFGLGTFYRREFTPDVFGFVNFSVSEAKDSREIEQYDIYGNSTVPGKLNRFMVFPLMFGVQYRLFREDIVDTFRPYVNFAAGPTLIYMFRSSISVPQPDGTIAVNEVDSSRASAAGRLITRHPRTSDSGRISAGNGPECSASISAITSPTSWETGFPRSTIQTPASCLPGRRISAGSTSR